MAEISEPYKRYKNFRDIQILLSFDSFCMDEKAELYKINVSQNESRLESRVQESQFPSRNMLKLTYSFLFSVLRVRESRLRCQRSRLESG